MTDGGQIKNEKRYRLINRARGLIMEAEMSYFEGRISMLCNDEEMNRLMDRLSHGLIFINKDEVIERINSCAEDITGAVTACDYSHDAGKIEEGDIVVIADSGLGMDDGGLQAFELSNIGIYDENIAPGDMLAAVGVYHKDSLPTYKYVREHLCLEPFGFETDDFGVPVAVRIDTKQRETVIAVEDMRFVLPYFYAVGHMVVLDGRTKKLKFYEAKGYSIRKESIGELLRGGSFYEKKAGKTRLRMIGQKMTDVFEAPELLEAVCSVLSNERSAIEHELFDINHRLMEVSVFPSFSEKPECTADKHPSGVWLVISEAAGLKSLLEKRDKLLLDIEAHFKKREKALRTVPEGLFTELEGCSGYMGEIKYLAYKAAKQKFNVMLTGESGTGKSLLARQIHEAGSFGGPYVEVNCAAIAPSLFESELFGYVGGAFTGALSSGREGYFEAADGGTIFLDEIGELPLEIQVKLLYVLQNKTIYRVGSSRPTKVNVRVITATNKDLGQAIKEGSFRQDLYYRLNVFPIHLTPLRERKEDLQLMIHRILEQTCAAFKIGTKRLSAEAQQKLMAYHWPGNVRELENVLQRAVSLCDSDIIFAEHIDTGAEDGREVLKVGEPLSEALKDTVKDRVKDTAKAAVLSGTLKERLEAAEADILKTTLEESGWNKEAVMKKLKVSKTVLYEKIRKYHLSENGK